MPENRRGGFLGWVGRLFKRRRPVEATAEPTPPTQASEPRSEVSTEPPTEQEPILVPTLGDVFDLHVLADFRWSSTQMSQTDLEERAKIYLENARRQLRRLVWPKGRTFEPGQTKEAEETFNHELRNGWCYDEPSGAVIRCSPTVRVLPDPRLREERLPFLVKRLDLAEAHAVGKLRAKLTRELTEEWLEVMQKLEQLPELGRHVRPFLVPFASSLADHEFAQVMSALANARRARTIELHGVLVQARNGHEQAGLFEFAHAYDKALEAFSRQMGLDPYSSFMAGLDSSESDEAGS